MSSHMFRVWKQQCIRWCVIYLPSNLSGCWTAGTGELPGVCASLCPAGEGPAWAGAPATQPVGASAGGGGLLSPALLPQRQAGGWVQQPQERPGPPGERTDCSWTSQTGRSVRCEPLLRRNGWFTWKMFEDIDHLIEQTYSAVWHLSVLL